MSNESKTVVFEALDREWKPCDISGIPVADAQCFLSHTLGNPFFSAHAN
jgi:hypothetical protein